MAWSSFRAPLAHYHYDSFQARPKGEERSLVDGELLTFALDGDANVSRVKFLGRTFRRAD